MANKHVNTVLDITDYQGNKYSNHIEIPVYIHYNGQKYKIIEAKKKSCNNQMLAKIRTWDTKVTLKSI